ncbi:MAG: 6-phosphogluconolactonase [Chloroflexota bacterium]|nr:6-phosphogluconolactonase [Chloroflexota bacterium]
MAHLERIEGLPVPAEVLIAPDPAGIAEASAERIHTWTQEALEQRPSTHVALTGGSSATHLHAELRKPRWRTALPWDCVHFWWGDDRFVPGDHPDSNFGAAFRELFYDDGLTVPGANIHPIPADTAFADDRDAAWTAKAYATELQTLVPLRDGLPILDVILLGMGPDGHVLSIFPHSPALGAGTPIVMDVPAPEHVDPKLPRVTLNPELLGVAGHVLVMVGGTAKALVVKQVLTGERDPAELPAQLATGPNATWILDRGSAAELKEPRVPAS